MSAPPNPDRKTAIAIKALVVDRGDRTVLHGVTCEVAAGTVTGLLGPSGCGKTTLMRSIVGVQIVRVRHASGCSASRRARPRCARASAT